MFFQLTLCPLSQQYAFLILIFELPQISSLSGLKTSDVSIQLYQTIQLPLRTISSKNRAFQFFFPSQIFAQNLEYSFSNKQEIVSLGQQQQQKIQLDMQYWCFNCSKIVLSNRGIKCQYCGSEAIEEMRGQNNPAQHIPFNLTAQAQPQEPVQQQTDGQEERTVITISFIRPMPLMMPAFFPMAPISFIRFINLGENENQSTPVADQKYEELQKIATLESECAVCQERSGTGVKLGCKHEFHEDCIKPWLKNANTCPCCRTTV